MDLVFISASVALGEPADCDLNFNLCEYDSLSEYAGQSFWNTVSPLRDRSSIRLLFSQPEPQAALQSIITGVQDLLENKEPLAGGTGEHACVRVGVACREGATLSPSFVEKLHEWFMWDGKTKDLLNSVQRFHYDVFSGHWGARPDRGFKWQKSLRPYHSNRRVASINFPAKKDTWIGFPAAVSNKIEDAFREDPFSANVTIEGDTINFTEGTIYVSSAEMSYQIRSAILFDKTAVPCEVLYNKSYKVLAASYNSAGILPYSIHPLSGEPVLLLGRINYACENWCDFGGLHSFREKPSFTAARECCEETLGVLGSKEELKAALRSYEANNAFKIVNQSTHYVSHILRVRFSDYCTAFEKRLDELSGYKRKKIEVTEMKWFPMSSIRKAVNLKLVREEYCIEVSALHGDDLVEGQCTYPLREEFVWTMCIAERLGVLDAIQRICRKLHQAASSRSRQDSSSPHTQPTTTTTTVIAAATRCIGGEQNDGGSSSCTKEVVSEGQRQGKQEVEGCGRGTPSTTCVKEEAVGLSSSTGTELLEGKSDDHDHDHKRTAANSSEAIADVGNDDVDGSSCTEHLCTASDPTCSSGELGLEPRHEDKTKKMTEEHSYINYVVKNVKRLPKQQKAKQGHHHNRTRHKKKLMSEMEFGMGAGEFQH